MLSALLWGCKDTDNPGKYEKFELESPELSRTLRIWVYLPESYGTDGQSYPVMYMQDGQWLFEKNPGYSQEMHVDETLRTLEASGFGGLIAVGIESEESTRGDEYSLYVNEETGRGGNGQAYLDFVVKTLKPYIDSEYRTIPDRQHTGIMGASLGGLITFFGLTEYPDVFSKAAMFSAAIHFNDVEVFEKAAADVVRDDVRIYAVVGAEESNELVNFRDDNQYLFTLLNSRDPAVAARIHFEIHPDGEHAIWYWEREFAGAMLFLWQ